MIKIAFCKASSMKDIFFDTPAEANNWLKTTNLNDINLFVDTKLIVANSLDKNLLKTAKEIMVQNKLIGA